MTWATLTFTSGPGSATSALTHVSFTHSPPSPPGTLAFKANLSIHSLRPPAEICFSATEASSERPSSRG